MYCTWWDIRWALPFGLANARIVTSILKPNSNIFLQAIPATFGYLSPADALWTRQFYLLQGSLYSPSNFWFKRTCLTYGCLQNQKTKLLIHQLVSALLSEYQKNCAWKITWRSWSCVSQKALFSWTFSMLSFSS